MSWESLAELVEDLQLRSDPGDYAAIKSEVRAEIQRVHPDRTNGKFESAEAEERFFKLKEALSYLETQKDSQALIPISQVPAIIKAFTKANESTREEKVAEAKKECREIIKEDISSKYRIPRLGSAVFATVCFALYNFSDWLYRRLPWLEEQQRSNSNAIIDTKGKVGAGVEYARDQMSTQDYYQLFTLTLFVVSAIFFVSTWRRERGEKQRDEWLTSDTARRQLFESLVRAKYPKAPDGRVLFSFVDWVQEVARYDQQKYGPVGQQIAEKVTNLHLGELKHRGLIREVKAKKVDALYEVEEEVIEDFGLRAAGVQQTAAVNGQTA